MLKGIERLLLIQPYISLTVIRYGALQDTEIDS